MNSQNNGANKEFEPQVYEIGGKTYTAYSPEEARALQTQRDKFLTSESQLAGQPTRPSWQSLIDPKTGLLKNQYNLTGYADKQMADDVGYNKFQEEALREGPSAYANILLDQQKLDNQNNLDALNSQYNMGLTSAFDQMSSQGGLMGGSRERIASNSIKDLLTSRQGARQDYNQNRLGILANDEQNRINQLQSLTGMEMDRNSMNLNARQSDIQNALSEQDAKRQDSMDSWKTQMETWASNKQADAQRSAAGGCFPGHVEILMADGSRKAIQDIKLGERVFSGGRVTKVIQALSKGHQWYSYRDCFVTGDHAVLENGKWVRVKDSEKGSKINAFFPVLFNLSTDGHILMVNDILFSDYDETDQVGLSYEDSLILKNKEDQCLQTIS